MNRTGQSERHLRSLEDNAVGIERFLGVFPILFVNHMKMIILLEDHLLFVSLENSVSFHRTAIADTHGMVTKLGVIFDCLQHHEAKGTRYRNRHIDLKLSPLPHLESRPSKDHRHG